MPWLTVVIGYLAGSIPFGLLLGFLAGKDIRQHGSGNIGATNVLRVCGPGWGIPALLLDILKGLAPVLWIAPLLEADLLIRVLTGIAAIMGHTFPVWLRFRGGKGVATSAGVVGALLPIPFAVALGVFILTVALSRYISLGSMLASVALVAAHLALAEAPFSSRTLPLTGMALLLCVLVILRHRANIVRLRNGTENRFGQKRDA
jgi:acyl phosphate:glycerol-3-phosphate acyltransferase